MIRTGSGIVLTSLTEYQQAIERVNPAQMPTVPLGGYCELRWTRVAGTYKGHLVREASA